MSEPVMNVKGGGWWFVVRLWIIKRVAHGDAFIINASVYWADADEQGALGYGRLGQRCAISGCRLHAPEDQRPRLAVRITDRTLEADV